MVAKGYDMGPTEDRRQELPQSGDALAGPDAAALQSRRERGPARWTPLGIALALIAVATLTPVPSEPGTLRIPFWCVACGTFGGADVLANIALFAPLGLAIGFTRMRRWQGLALALVVTSGVELLQYKVIPGRHGSFSDILTNTVGALAGMGLFALWRWVAATPERAVRAALGYGACIATLVGGGLALQATAIQRSTTRELGLYWTDGSPDGRPSYYKVFTGTVRGVQLGDRARVTVALISGSPASTPAELVWIGHVAQGKRTTDGVAWLDQFGRDLHAHVVSRADYFGLRGHGPILEDALPENSGEPVSIELAVQPFGYRITAHTAAGDVAQDTEVSPGDGWKLLTPFAQLRQRWKANPLLTGLWMAGLLAPLGYLSAVRPAATASASVGTSAYLVALPLTVGCGWLPLTGWTGAAVGFLIGRYLHR